MKKVNVATLLGLLAVQISLSQLLIAAETEMSGVTASLVQLRQYNGALRVEIVLKNSGDKEASASGPLEYSQIVLVDAQSQQKHFAMKDANGHYLAGPISDWGGGGRWWPKIRPGEEARVWLFFQPLQPGKKVSVHVPFMFPFDDVSISEGAPDSTTDAAGSITPLNAHLVSAKRSAGQLRVQLKITNPGKGSVSGEAIRYADVAIFDPHNKQEYSLLKDTEGNFLAQPMSDKGDGGRWWLSVQPGGAALMSLTFSAPPDSVQQVDLLIPGFTPLEAISLSGVGGSSGGGVGVAGKSLGLESALKNLHAEVTAQEIKVNLAADLLFDFDKSHIKPEAEPSLQDVVAVLKAYPTAQVQINGHTDGKGTHEYNMTLSEKRAQSVKSWLVQNASIAASRITTRGWGETKSVAPNTLLNGKDNPEGRQKNRRVEIFISKG